MDLFKIRDKYIKNKGFPMFRVTSVYSYLGRIPNDTIKNKTYMNDQQLGPT